MNITIIQNIKTIPGGVPVSEFSWVSNLFHIRLKYRLEERRNAYQFDTLISAIETMTGKEDAREISQRMPPVQNMATEIDF